MDDKFIKANLLSGLLDYWPLTEQSGIRNSLFGRNSLTDNNTVTGNPGLFGMASQFTSANSEWLTIADKAYLSAASNSFTVTAWVKPTTISGSNVIVSKHAVGQREFWIALSASAATFRVSGDGTNITAVSGPTYVAENQWSFVAGWLDIQASIIAVRANGGPHKQAVHTAKVFDSTANFGIGGTDPATNFFNGIISSVGYWKRVLSLQELDYIYNNGLGRPLFSP